MNRKEMLSHIDHTQLKPTSDWASIARLCDEAAAYGTASVCIPPSYVAEAAAYLEGRLPVCTVIGFPNGYNTTAVKAFETEEALENGASEIDMVINLGWLKSGRYDRILEEIRSLRTLCSSAVLKVIVETCLLTREEKIRMCQVVTESGADFIKTSTGFSTGGATFEDVALLAQHVGPQVRVKAAGGISSFADAQRFLELGASRLGTSRIVKLAKAEAASRNTEKGETP